MCNTTTPITDVGQDPPPPPLPPLHTHPDIPLKSLPAFPVPIQQMVRTVGGSTATTIALTVLLGLAENACGTHYHLQSNNVNLTSGTTDARTKPGSTYDAFAVERRRRGLSWYAVAGNHQPCYSTIPTASGSDRGSWTCVLRVCCFLYRNMGPQAPAALDEVSSVILDGKLYLIGE